jgi:hypothetical protein
MADRKDSGCEKARKTGETARVTLARARGGAPAETTRESQDWLKGQPQERQHSAAEGGTRDRQPPGELLKSDFARHWYQFCVCDIVSMLRVSRSNRSGSSTLQN